jgi:hypothetical protein
MSILCSMVGASFTVAAVAQVLRSKKGITAIGNAQISTAQSKFGGASALFDDASQNYLSIANSTDLLTGTGALTIEGWFRPQLAGATDQGVGTRFWYFKGVNSATGLGLGVTTDGIRFRGPSQTDLVYTGSVSNSAWSHIAFVWDGTTKTIYLNGTNVASASASLNITDTSNVLIGATFADARFNYDGYIDEIRISNSARYTANFTPSTTAFVNDANTVFLMHANGTNASTFFEDDNGVRASRSLIAQGNAQIDTAQSKFGGSALLCDGTGDYVMSPAGTQWDFGTSSFTIEYWIRFNVAPTLYVPIALRPSGSINNGEWWCEITNAEKKMYWGFKNFAGTQFYVNLGLSGNAFTTGQWYHIALVNNAGTARMYVDGTATGTSTALSGSFGISTTDLWVGAGAGSYSLNGWMDEVRISNTARYTTGFTPSTTPFVNDANTLLLIHGDGTNNSTVFRDDNGARAQKGIQAIGNAQIDTAQSKFGGASALFDGTGDYCISYGNFTLGTGDWTIESWVRPQTTAETNNYLCDLRSNSGPTIAIIMDSNKLGYRIFYGGSVVTGGTLTADTWNHIAMVKSGTTIYTFTNGVLSNTYTSVTTNYPVCSSIVIGARFSISEFFNGHMDEFRVSDSARYTAAFTPSTTPFQSDANTLLLLHCDGTDASTAFFDDNGIAPYTP